MTGPYQGGQPEDPRTQPSEWQRGQGGNQPQPGTQGVKDNRSKLLVIGLVVLVVIAGGAVATVLAVKGSSSSGGQSSAEAASDALVSQIDKGDVLAIANSLVPVEKQLFVTDYQQRALDEAKRLQIVKPDTAPDSAYSGVIKGEGLSYGGPPKQINDHLAVRTLTAGKITLESNTRSSSLTKEFQDAIQADPSATGPQTLDLSKAGHPVQVATVKVGDEWYPSVFYTIANAAITSAGKAWPGRPIAAAGADTPQDAARQMIEALVAGDYRRAIELTPPDEAGALHDAGALIVDSAGSGNAAADTVTNLRFATSDTIGGTLVSPTDVRVQTPNGTIEVHKSGDCLAVTIPSGQSQDLCSNQIGSALSSGAGVLLPAEVTGVVTHLATGLLNKGLGVVATQVDSKWYVSPTRSFLELGLNAMHSLQPGDLVNLLKLAH